MELACLMTTFAIGNSILMLTEILENFGLEKDSYIIEKINNGLINNTWKVSGGGKEYIIQKINKAVFKSPRDIADNLKKIGDFLLEFHPNYLFVAPLPSKTGEPMVQDEEGNFYRLTPFIKNSHTINVVHTAQEAFEAARQFGRFTSLLAQFDCNALSYTLPDFHNLSLRFAQFEEACLKAKTERLALAETAIHEANKHRYIAETYKSILSDKHIPQRVIHHDTKISNVLFDENDRGLCVIDLDTVMPGYFFSDVGDMMRTYLSPVNEEEKDFDKISIRSDYFKAILDGYLSEMAEVLTDAEKNLFIYSGEFMIYMQALRFLTDFLNNDIYYSSSYENHNLIRAQNQFVLLNKYQEAEGNFSKYVLQYVNNEVKSA